MYDTTIATKLIGQLDRFLGRISPRFHKPVARFIGDMMYGIMAEKDVKLSSVVRALKEGITPKKVEDRLSRMLSSKGLERGLHDAIAAEGAGKVRQDTLIILDPSDVQKPFAKKMEHLAKVWDGSKGDVGGRPCDPILQHGVDRQLAEARGHRKEHRPNVVQDTRRAGLPLLRHRGRHERHPEEPRRKMAGVRPC